MSCLAILADVLVLVPRSIPSAKMTAFIDVTLSQIITFPDPPFAFLRTMIHFISGILVLIVRLP
jgi:hypothetical protein